MYQFPRALALALLLALAVGACKKKPIVEDVAPVTSVSGGGGGGASTGGPTTTTATPGRDNELIATMIAANMRSMSEPIHFGYDMSELSMEARAKLDMKIAIMRENPTVRVRIEGHCDSRGSNEYNLALGQRRAAAARDYMENRGIVASRIETVSLGEERPAMQGESESAWAANRRDEFSIVAGSITKPVGN